MKTKISGNSVIAGLTRNPMTIVNGCLTFFRRLRVKPAMTVTILLTASLSVQAQEKNPDLQRELTLEKEYNPNLRDANKLNQLPEIKAPEASRTQVEFSNYTLDCAIPPYFQPFGAINYFPDFATSNKKGYLNAGVSTLLDVDADLGYQLLNSATDRLSIFGSHRSSNSKVTSLQTDEKQKMKINDNLLGFDYNHAFEKARLFADAQYTYSGFNYYGLPVLYLYPDNLVHDYPSMEQSDQNQVNNLFRIHSGIASEDNDEITYKVNLAYTLFKQKYGDFEDSKGRTENRLMADVNLHAHFNSTAGIGIGGSVKNYSYTVPFDQTIIDNLGTILGNRDYTTFSVNPYFTLEGDNWNARLGAGANAQVGGIKKFMVAPDVRFNWYPAEQFLFYLLAEGGIKDNSNYNLYYENRYINPKYRVYDSKSPLDGTAGIDFSPASNWNIGLFTGYQFVKDEHLYISNGSLPIYLGIPFLMGKDIIPQYVNAEKFKLGGTINYAYQDIFDLGLKVTYNHWNVNELSNIVDHSEPFYKLKAWNKPVFTGDLNLGYKIPVVPFRLDLIYHLETGRKNLNINTGDESMKNIHDVSFSGTYTLNETLSVFAKANNLLFQKYDLWYGYPAQNFNIMLGMNSKF